MSGPRLTSEEDAELRRLHVLAAFGQIAGKVAARYSELRSRDRRKEIREPVEFTSSRAQARQ